TMALPIVVPQLDPCALERCRQVQIADGQAMQVPRHIARLETGNTAGWIIRFASPSKFFSDKRHGGAAAALEQAKQHLRATWKPTPKQTPLGRSWTNNPTPGVRVQRKGSRVYAVATHPVDGSPKRFELDPSSALDLHRQSGYRRALAARQSWVMDHSRPLR